MSESISIRDWVIIGFLFVVVAIMLSIVIHNILRYGWRTHDWPKVASKKGINIGILVFLLVGVTARVISGAESLSYVLLAVAAAIGIGFAWRGRT